MRAYENKSAYQALFEHSNIGMIVSDHEGTIERVNPFANKIFGYGENELIGQKIEVLIPGRLKDKHVGHRSKYIHEPKPRSMGTGMDLSARHKDGTEFPVEISLASYALEGQRRVVSFVHDITERKKAEESLKKLNLELEMKVGERTKELSEALFELSHINESLEAEMEQRKKIEKEVRRALEQEKELGDLKSRFVSMASHEFRTPLAGILTSAALIEKYGQPQDAPKREKHVQTIKRSVQNLTSILNDFLSLDKLEQGKVETHPVSFNLREFCETLTAEMHELMKCKDRILCHHEGEEEVHLDRDLVRNLLINLLSNALKYSPDDKTVSLATEARGPHVLFTIRDEGIGIPEADQKHLFERFFRAKNAMTTQGTGLGLSIVRRYLDLMGGSIECSSRENAGTTFKVTLPREIS